MKAINPNTCRGLLAMALVLILTAPVYSQTCPSSGLTTLTSYPNVYYPGTQASAPSGSTSMTLGPAGYGSHTIVPGDVILIIQMQGADFDMTNSSNYGSGTRVGRGYYNDANLLAGNFEFAIAANTVPATGGTLTLASPLQYSYKNTAYSASGTGQYTYQILYVPQYYDIKLSGTINVPAWNGSTGGVLMLVAEDILDFNGATINGVGAGFRGGATRQLRGGTGDNATDYATLSTINNNGGKGEGIAGTPRFVNNAGVLLDNGSNNEGYPLGAEGRGAPGNAAGGGTDADPSANDENDGGGGGGNGGIGGSGGNSWSSNHPYGGIGGAAFAQASPTQLVLGGGGGGGTNNDGTGGSNGFYSSGNAGGGLVIIYAGTLNSSSHSTINVGGANGYSGDVQNDGTGGGGAGGSVLLYANSGSSLAKLTVTANGGNGGTNSGAGAKHGPGGGGGGGVIFSNVPIGLSTATGGPQGATYGGTSYGAGGGFTGITNANIASTSITPYPVTCALLPVNFLSFAAQPANGNITLNWIAESLTAKDYVVERSFDGNSFDPIGPAETANNGTSSYSYIDKNATSPTGTIFYRIREEDATGASFYSTVVTVKISTPAVASGVYPNPATESITLTFNASAAGAVSLRLFDLGGRLMLSQPYQANTGINAVTMNGLGVLPEGLYILQWSDGLKPWSSKVLIRH